MYYFWLQRLVKVVKSVKKDVESRVESKGLYRGIKVVFFLISERFLDPLTQQD